MRRVSPFPRKWPLKRSMAPTTLRSAPPHRGSESESREQMPIDGRSSVSFRYCSGRRARRHLDSGPSPSHRRWRRKKYGDKKVRSGVESKSEARFDRPAQSAPSERHLHFYVSKGEACFCKRWCSALSSGLVEKLIPYARNPRTHSDAQVAQIAASIAEFGFNNPILVDTKAGIIAGHGRLLAARKLQLTEVPVIILDHLTRSAEARVHPRRQPTRVERWLG